MKTIDRDNDQFKISIIMSVYNDEKYLSESIESILNQTYKNYEFIILNDGSTDNSKNIIVKYKKIDSRIIFIDGIKEGLTKKLNKGIKISTGNFIARQDSDDISHENRLESQINFFKINQDYALCATFAEIINEKNKIIKRSKSVFQNNKIKEKLKYSNIIIHPSVMVNKIVIKNFFYDERFVVSQDYELWTRIARDYKCYIIPKYLIKNRRHKLNISKKSSILQEKNSIIISFLYSFNLQLPSINITDVSLSFNELIAFYNKKNEIYEEDLKIRRYVYLYKTESFLSIFKIKSRYLHKVIVFYFHKPSMLFKRLINSIKI